jgi:hypothetical protein
MFSSLGDVILMVQGSDSTPEYIEKCREACKRKCGVAECKKAHRRINIYRGFVEANFKELNENYTFMGGENIDNHNIMEPFERNKKYNAVWVMKKNV